MAGPASSTTPIIGLQFNTVVSTVVNPTTIITPLAGFGDGFFQDWYVSVVRSIGGIGAAPQGDYILCTQYTSRNGQMVLQRIPNGAPFTVGDQIYLIHPVLLGSLNVVVQPSNNIKESSDAEVTTAAAGYTKVKELAFTGAVGGARIFFDLRTDGVGGIAYAVVYKNGVPVITNPSATPDYTEWTDITGTYHTITQDISGLALGDLIQIYAKASAGHVSYVRNFRVGYDIVALPAVQAGIDTVYYDQVNGVSGTAWPIGTNGHPVNNLADVMTIAANRGLKNIHIAGKLTLDRDVIGYNFIGSEPFTDIIDFNLHDVGGSTFQNLNLYGATMGYIYADHCVLGQGITSPGVPPTIPVIFNGEANNCFIFNITVPFGFYVGLFHCGFDQYYLPPPPPPIVAIIDGEMDMFDCSTELVITGMTDPTSALYVIRGDMTLTLLAGCIDGFIYIDGQHRVQNFTTGATIVVDLATYKTGNTCFFQSRITSPANALRVLQATAVFGGVVPTTQISLVRITRLSLRANGNTTANLTSAGVYAAPLDVLQLIDPALAILANLATVGMQQQGVGPWDLANGEEVIINLVGTGAAPVDLTLTIEYKPLVDGAQLV